MTSLSTDFITAAELAESLGLSYGTAKKILEATGTGQAVSKVINIYDREAAKVAVAKKYEKVLEFLGCSMSQSWDADA